MPIAKVVAYRGPLIRTLSPEDVGVRAYLDARDRDKYHSSSGRVAAVQRDSLSNMLVADEDALQRRNQLTHPSASLLFRMGVGQLRVQRRDAAYATRHKLDGLFTLERLLPRIGVVGEQVQKNNLKFERCFLLWVEYEGTEAMEELPGKSSSRKIFARRRCKTFDEATEIDSVFLPRRCIVARCVVLVGKPPSTGFGSCICSPNQMGLSVRVPPLRAAWLSSSVGHTAGFRRVFRPRSSRRCKSGFSCATYGRPM